MTTAARVKSIALPAEHGSWGLVIEPICLGLLVAPSWPGLWLALAAFCAFLAYHPLRVILADLRRNRRTQRTALASRFLLGYGGLSLLLGALAVLSGGWSWLLPLGLALPFLALFLLYDQRPGRHWQAELAAPIGYAAIAAAIPMAAGWEWAPALALWGVMAARGVPAVLYVRARLRLVKGKPAQVALAMGAHLTALIGVGWLVAVNLLPASAEIGMILLLIRASIGLSPWRRPLTTKQIGFLEMGFGLLTVLLVVSGY